LLNSTRRMAVNRRARFAVISNALISATSFLLAVAVARRADIHEFGEFTLAIATFLLLLGLVRASVTETTLARIADSAENANAFQKVTLLSLVAGAALTAVGLIWDLPYFTVLGLSFNGLAALDYVRTVNAALYRESSSLFQGALWCFVGLGISGISLVVYIPPIVVFAAWAVSGAVIGYGCAIAGRYGWRPSWSARSGDNHVALFFAADYLAGSGGSLLSTSLLGITAGPATVGAIRGAGTLLGPANLISGTARSLAIPYLTRARQSEVRDEFSLAVRSTIATALISLPLAVGVCLIPDPVGVWLLGDSWDHVLPVLPALAIEALLALISSIPAAGFRSRLAGAKALRLRLITGIPRPVLVVTAAYFGGALGAAWSLAGIAAINAAMWWWSYRKLTSIDEPQERRN